MNKHLAFLAGLTKEECYDCGRLLTVEEYAYGHDCDPEEVA